MSSLSDFRAPHPPQPEWEQRALETLQFLRFYARCDLFQNDLIELYEAFEHHAETSRPVVDADYRAAVENVAQRWGLHRLPEVKGLQAIVAWCTIRERIGTLYIEPRHFGIGLTHVGFRPVVDSTVHIQFTAVWEMDDESLRQARDRMLVTAREHIEAELSRLKTLAETQGWLFRDSHHKQGEHMEMLFLAVARKKSVTQIAVLTGTSESAVRKALAAMQARLALLPDAQKADF